MISRDLLHVLIEHQEELELLPEDIVFLVYLLAGADAKGRIQVSVARLTAVFKCDRRTVERRIQKLHSAHFFSRTRGTGNVAALFDFEPLPERLRAMVSGEVQSAPAE